MGDQEPEPLQQDEGVNGDQTKDLLKSKQNDRNDPEVTETNENGTSDKNECMGPSSNEDISHKHTTQQKDIPSSGDGDHADQPTNLHCDGQDQNKTDAPDGAPDKIYKEQPVVTAKKTSEANDKDEGISESADDPSNQTDSAAPDQAPDILNEDSKEQSGFTTEETSEANNQENEGTAESAADKLQGEPAEDQTVPKTNVETIGPTSVKSTPTSNVQASVKDHKRRNIFIAIALVAVAIILQQLLQPRDSPRKADLRQIDIFHREMEKVKVQFPSQRKELWKRSRIHLQRHFQITQATEPISIILTAGVRAENTLHCLAQSIASALSSTLNASVLYLDGASKSSQDSDKVKSDIDSQLQKAFEGGKPIAVIHRFEELPPASTLIFYRYCDHENAAFKKTFLIFTVLLGEEEEIQENIRLSEVEEMVTDHLQKKFLSHGHPTAFDKMDIDKYGGLWSRISHLILPVATEKRIENTKQC